MQPKKKEEEKRKAAAARHAFPVALKVKLHLARTRYVPM